MTASAIELHRRGKGPALVLLHCLGVDHGLWDLAAPGLPDAFTCLSYDFPGHGESPLSAAPCRIEGLSADLAALMEREGVGRAHIAGISLGGLVAQHLAATRPDLVDRLVLIDTTPRYTDEMRDGWIVRAETARSRGVSAMTDQLLRVWFTDGAVDADGAAVRYVRDRFASCDGEGYARACEALAAADLRALLPRIKAPTLVICGDGDLPSFREAAEWMRSSISGSELAWLAPARHASVLEQPEQFVAALRRFLSPALGVAAGMGAG